MKEKYIRFFLDRISFEQLAGKGKIILTLTFLKNFFASNEQAIKYVKKSSGKHNFSEAIIKGKVQAYSHASTFLDIPILYGYEILPDYENKDNGFGGRVFRWFHSWTSS